MQRVALLSLLLAPAAVASTLVAGCGSLACDARCSGAQGLPLPLSPPRLAWALPQRSSLPSPGCVSNLGTAFCAANLSAAAAAAPGAVRGGAFVSAAGALLSAPDSPALEWCASDGSQLGRGAQLGVMSIQGDLAAWGPTQLAVLGAATGAPRWAEALQPPSPCAARGGAPGGLASVALAAASTLTFAREAGEVFAYYASGVPDAALTLLANSSGNYVPAAQGVLVPLARATDGGARTLYLARFYACAPTPAGGSACSSASSTGAAAAPGAPALLPTPELRLAAVDARHGTPADPRRLEAPWVNLGPAAFPVLPPALAACTPSASGGERLAVSATVLPGGAALVGAFVCLGSAGGGGAPAPPAAPPLFLACFGTDGNASAARHLWQVQVDTGGWWQGGGAALHPPVLLQDAQAAAGGAAAAAQLPLWATAGGGATGSARLLALNASTGALLSSSAVAELVQRAPPSAAAACPLAALLAAAPNASLTYTAPSRTMLLGQQQQQSFTSGLLMSLALQPSGGQPGTAWLAALGLTAAASAELLWCSSLPVGGYQGQFVALTAAPLGQAPQPANTTILGVTAEGIWGVSWA